MVVVLSIDASDFNKKMKALPSRIKRVADNSTFDLARDAVRNLKLSLSRFVHTGDDPSTVDRIRYEKNKSGYAVSVPLRSLYLDRMRPHWVWVRPWRRIGGWARTHGYKGGFVYVKPHPWIDAALENTIANAQSIVDFNVRREFK